MSSQTLPRPAAAPPASAAPGAARDPFLDNARFLLVVLVVIGHSWEEAGSGVRGLKAAHLFLYAFHMPVLVLLCGYFSRHFTGRSEQIRKLVAGVLLPYLIFETAYTALYTLALGKPFAVTPTSPTYLCWFLLALFLWRITAPLWGALRCPVGVAVAVSLAAGLTGMTYELALPRVLMFLPWFVLGLRMRREHFRYLRSPAARIVALPVVVCGAAGAWWAAPRVGADWTQMQYGAAELGVPAHVYAAVRIGLFGVSAVLGAAFLALVPVRRSACTALGAVTLYPFLLHGLFLKALAGGGAYGVVRAAGPAGFAVLTVCAAALAVLLSAPAVRRILRPLVEPRLPGFLTPHGVPLGAVR